MSWALEEGPLSVLRGRLGQGNLYKGEDVWIVDWIEYWMDRVGDLYVWSGLSTCTGARGSHRGSKTW